MQAQYASNAPRQPVQPGPPGAASMFAPAAPAGTFASGTKVQVGESRVVIDRYLSEGGFAHVYLVKLPKPVGGTDRAVLKRVAVPDKEALANMRTEVETMKKLKGHRQIVTYFDSHASQLKGGGYEVFLLMEYCAGGGLIDFMNTRLQNRLTEVEILKIFSDTAQGVACMHYLKPPLLHRDLKVENILIQDSGGSKQFKLCDFGSAASPRPAATSAAEGRLIEEDVQKHTTMQYRSPEMIDVYRKQPIDEKSDIWALGVLLYKLCYYTTPFEEQGQMAILNARFRFPGYPQFSDRIKKLIAMMLQEKPSSRPNIYQVVKEVCAMRGTECPLKDIYSGRTASESRRNQELPPTPGQISSPPVVAGAYKVAPVEEKVSIPDIAPMRRGRPTSHNLTAEGHSSAKPSPSPRRPVEGDPFAALDANGTSTNVTVDELSSRFPSLDHFSLLHESGGTFNFEQPKQSSHQREASNVTSKPRDLSQRVTEVLADEAFAVPAAAKTEKPVASQSVPSQINQVSAGTQTNNVPSSPALSHQARKPGMVSTGTMTNEMSPPPKDTVSQRPIFKFPPSDHRSSSQPRAPSSPYMGAENDASSLTRPTLYDHRSLSQTSGNHKPSSSRPSLESSRLQASDTNSEMSRSRSANPRSRPVSTHLESAANFIKGRSTSRGKEPEPELIVTDLTGKSQEGTQIRSNVDFLRAMEEEESAKRKEKRLSTGSKHSKRSSMPSVSLSGTKNLLAGRFGDAFKRFEQNSGPTHDDEQGFNNSLTPISGSVATDDRSDDGHALEETEEMSPEMRRELERRRLSQEERRVADAAAAYKQGLAGPPRKDNSRATSIQNKVQALLDESSKPSAPQAVEGYGRFTDSPAPMPSQSQTPKTAHTPRQTEVPLRQPISTSNPLPTSGTVNPSSRPNPPPKPQPKPQALRTGGTGGPTPPIAAKPANLTGAATRTTMAVRGGGVGLGVSGTNSGPPTATLTNRETVDDDWEANFSKKYPSLAGLEMVETEISAGGGVVLGEKGVRDI